VDGEKKGSLRDQLWEIVFEAETPAGKAFDIFLLWMIFISVVAVMLESVKAIKVEWGQVLLVFEWVFTILFTIEYFLRIWLVRKPLKYMTSFFGMVDLLSCLPTYLSLFFAGAQSLLVIRILRLLRMFRVLKMVGHMKGADTIMRGLLASRAKIVVFFMTVLLLSVLAGTLMYLVESGTENSKFTSIPMSIYYAIVSITTVGYGDMVATTVVGKMLSAFFVLTGYSIIAVPTGIVTMEMMEANKKDNTTDACPGCGVHGHLLDAEYCRKCGERLD